MPGNFDLCSLSLTISFASGATKLKMFSSFAFLPLSGLINITMRKIEVLYTLWKTDLKALLANWQNITIELSLMITLWILANFGRTNLISY